MNKKEKISLILQPHCAMLFQPLPMMDQKMCNYFNNQLDKLPTFYAKEFGIPTVFCNKSGPMESVIPSGVPSRYFKSKFAGCSKIVDKTAEIVNEAKYNEDDKAEIIIGEIELGQNCEYIGKEYGMIEGDWTSFYDMPRVIKFGFIMSETFGWIGYNLSVKRRMSASRITNDWSWISSWIVHGAYGVILGRMLYDKFS